MECALIKHIHSIDTFNDQQKADATRGPLSSVILKKSPFQFGANLPTIS